MVAVQVMGNDAAIGFAGSQGNFELTSFKPVMVFNYLHSVELLADACNSFVDHCVVGIELNRAQIDSYVQNSLCSSPRSLQNRLRQRRKSPKPLITPASASAMPPSNSASSPPRNRRPRQTEDMTHP